MTDKDHWKQVAQDAWNNPRWKEAAREYHKDRAGRALIVEIEPERLKLLRRLNQPNVTLDQAYRKINANRPTPKVTVEAIMLAVRERGFGALREAAVKARIAGFDNAARHTLKGRLRQLKGQTK
jgi:hypothetical protein